VIAAREARPGPRPHAGRVDRCAVRSFHLGGRACAGDRQGGLAHALAAWADSRSGRWREAFGITWYHGLAIMAAGKFDEIRHGSGAAEACCSVVVGLSRCLLSSDHASGRDRPTPLRCRRGRASFGSTSSTSSNRDAAMPRARLTVPGLALPASETGLAAPPSSSDGVEVLRSPSAFILTTKNECVDSI
jgi:hypothetical protein